MSLTNQNYESFDRAPAGVGGGSGGLNFADIMRDYPMNTPAPRPAGPMQQIESSVSLPPILLCSTNANVDFAGLASGASDTSTRTVLATWGRFGNNPTSSPGMGAIGMVTGLDVGPEFAAGVAQRAWNALDPVNRALQGDVRQAEAIQDGHGRPAAIRANGGNIQLNINGRMQNIPMDFPGAGPNDFVMLYRVPVSGGWNLVAVNPRTNESWAWANVQYNADPSRLLGGGNGLMGGYSWVPRR